MISVPYLATLTIGAALLTTASSQSLPARQADAFVDSIGVNVHLHYYDTAYDDFEKTVLPRLGELGVRHIRDGICPVQDGTKPGRLQTLFTELGIRATLIADPRCESVAEAFNHVKITLGSELIAALEGPNEYDLSDQADWTREVRAFQQELFLTFKAAPETAAIPIIGPSVTSEPAAQKLGDVAGKADIVNLHSYYSFRPPETSGWGPNGYGSLGWQLGVMGERLGATDFTSLGALPVIVTEAGYHNAYRATGQTGLPEEVTAAYLPRLLFSHFEAGITRTFIYELLDEWDEPEDREANFGLVRFDGTKKPAFVALKNLIALLADPGQAFVPGSLEVNLQALPDTVSWSLMQKRDGNFYLALWDNTAIFDPETDNPEIAHPRQTVSLRFGEPLVAVSRAIPNESIAWEPMSLTDDELTLTISPEITLLRLTKTPLLTPKG